MSLLIPRAHVRNGNRNPVRRPHSSRNAVWGLASGASPMDRLFEQLWRDFDVAGPASVGAPVSGFVPRVDVSETETAYRVTAELPGVAEDDIEVVLEDGVLTVKGEKKSLHIEEDEKHRRAESAVGSFERRVRFASAIDEDGVTAQHKHGVLIVTLPKPEEARPTVRSIPIETR